MAKNIYTTVMSLLLVAVLSTWSTRVCAQSHRVHHKVTHTVRTSRAAHNAQAARAAHARGSHASDGYMGRKTALGVSITLSRTSRESREGDRSNKTGTETDMTSGYMTGVFLHQKGHLPWPVDSRNVATRFGYQPYELNHSVYRNNLGINISVDQDSCVRVVYDGVVDDVMDIGDAKAVIVAHGKYFTIYSDLSMSIVAKGQVVTAGDVLGQVGESGQVDFRIFDPYDVWQDPQKWLVKRK